MHVVFPPLRSSGWQWYYRRYIDVKKGGVGGLGMLLAGYCVLSYIWSYPHISECKHHSYYLCMVGSSDITKHVCFVFFSSRAQSLEEVSLRFRGGGGLDKHDYEGTSYISINPDHEFALDLYLRSYFWKYTICFRLG